MDLIDWNALFSNFVWILAVAWLLAIVSMARWEAIQKGSKTSAQLNQPKYQIQLNLGGLLFCLGLGLVADKTWEMVLWFLLSVVFLIQVVFAFRKRI